MIAGITASTRRGSPPQPEQYVPLIVEASGVFTVQANREVELLFSWDNLNWSQVTVLGHTEVSPPPHGETLCYIREADTSNTEGISFPSQQFTNGRNFHGVVQWWDSPTPIKLNLGWKDFYVPQESPENITNMSNMFFASYVFNQDISGWDVSKAENMDRMFMTALEFNQDLSGWCVSQFPQEPFDFSRETDSWTLPKPVWGTCPQRFIRLDYRDAVEGSVGAFSAFGKYNGDLISGQPPAFLGEPVYRNGFYYHPVVYTNGSQSFTIIRISQEPEIDFNGSSGQAVLNNLDSAGLDRIEVTYAGVVSSYVVPRSSYNPSGNFLEIQAGPWPSQIVYNNCKSNPVGNFIKLFWN